MTLNLALNIFLLSACAYRFFIIFRAMKRFQSQQRSIKFPKLTCPVGGTILVFLSVLLPSIGHHSFNVEPDRTLFFVGSALICVPIWVSSWKVLSREVIANK